MVQRGLAVAALVAVLDQLSKFWVLARFADRPPFQRIDPVTPFFNLVLTWNRGVSFGVFNNESPFNAVVFSLVAAVIVAMLLVWLRRADDRLLATAIGLVIGGAVGNVIDRLVRGAVVDFLDFHAAGWHWPAFNVADAAITVGAVLMLFDGLRSRAERPNP